MDTSQKIAHDFRRYITRMILMLSHPDIYYRNITLPTSGSPVPPEISDNPKFAGFEGAIGAIDGTKLMVTPPADRRASFRSYKGLLQQNLLAAVSFDMRFVYLLSGWEGTARDTAVMNDARGKSLRVPAGRYYLGDAAFVGSEVCMTPFAGTAYHLREFGARNTR